jgi:uncharacterized protein (TIGR02246 family)
MKMRFPCALVGLAIGFAAPAFAQQKDTVDPKIAQEIRALFMKFDEAFNKNDAAALAAFYTQDAVFVTPDEGTLDGRQAIETYYAKHEFQDYHCKNLSITVDQVNAVGNEVSVIGRWSDTFFELGFTKQAEGQYLPVLVREGDTWKIRRASADIGDIRAL